MKNKQKKYRKHPEEKAIQYDESDNNITNEIDQETDKFKIKLYMLVNIVKQDLELFSMRC